VQETLRMQAVQDPVIPIVARMVRECPGTISLGQGVVHYGPPSKALAQIERCLADPDNHKYRAVHGIPELVAAIEAKLEAENGIPIETHRRVVVTAGGNMAFQSAVLAITDPGDEIILQAPYYFNHHMAIAIAGCRPVIVPTDARYQLQPDAIAAAITPRTRAIVTVSPNNPTGAVYPEAALREINALCRRHGLYHISDEAYEYFTYDGACHFSPGSLPDSAGHTISLYSLSKAYGMASWRIGYLVLPEHLFEPVEKIQDTLLICPPVICQYAAIGALSAGAAYCREHLGALAQVRAMAVETFNTLRPHCVAPPADGAFYFLLQVHTNARPMELVERLIREHSVAVLPGDAFGMEAGCSLRVAYGALSPQTAMEGIGRLARGLQAMRHIANAEQTSL